MVFSSTVFLFLFLPIALLSYFLVRSELRNAWLLAVSLFFYAWGETFLVSILFISIIVNYISGLLISNGFSPGSIHTLPKDCSRSRAQKLGLVLSITVNLALLGFFKYFNFGMDSFNDLMAVLGFEQGQWDTTLRITLPLGISFFTFQSMSYTIDVYLGNTKATRNILNFATFVTLFPQLVAGPIVRYKQIADDLVSRTVTLDCMAGGSKRFVIGLGKKMIIANTVAWPADQIFALPDSEITMGLAWFGILCYTLQIYFDFSGYSDMAIGIGLMFGFRFPENFNYPYISQSIKDFWRRWHISLSSWFRDYLYIPLGGSQKGTFRTYFNLVLVFFLCGLWHGASWTFVVWGLYHGFFLVIERMRFGDWISWLWRPLRHTYTLIVAMVGWLLFRAETFSQALIFLKAMVGFAPGDGIVHSAEAYCTNEVGLAILLGIIGSLPWLPTLQSKLTSFADKLHGAVGRPLEFLHRVMELAFLCVVFVYCAMLLSAQTHNPFIYFRF
ncbi:MAG: MBOAT family O-acyltransferase [Candidatus Hydrogenedentota bacterium]